ncbi:MAG: substrate-binding domain-containing protein [Chloroflexi bacterium]|nr:substrate-binding domain-containing protein [Chloroflexota bacterium]
MRLSGSGSAVPAAQKASEGYESQAPGVKLDFKEGSNSGGAIRGVIDGTLDIGVVNRPLTEAEAREGLVYQPFAKDAVVFAVHQTTPVRGLRTAQLRDVYNGTTTSWRALSDTDAPIIVLDRDEDEAQRKLVLLPLMAGRAVKHDVVTLTSAGDMMSALDSTPYAIGYTSLGLLKQRAPKNVAILDLDEVRPSATTVASGAYPWSLTFGFVTRANASAEAREYIAHVQRVAPSLLPALEYAPLAG